MNDPVQLRKYVREVMAFAAHRAFTERMIFDGVKRLARESLQVDEFKAALHWNAAQGFVASKPDEDAAQPGEEAPLLWSMTAKGKAREGLAT